MEKEAEAAAIEAADLERRLARCTVPSPLTGVVLTRRLEESRGMHVAQGAGLLRVGDCSRIHFRALMDARAVGPVKVGMEARVHLRSFPGRTLEGKVFSVSRQPVHEEDTRLKEVTGAHWEVVVEVDPGEAPVLPGMTGEVAILVARSTLAAAFVRGVRDTVRSDLLR